MAFLKIATLDDLWSGEMIGLTVDGIPILLINANGQLCAYTDVCPHLGTRLSQGSFTSGVLSCATHQWQFDAQTGRGINPRTACLEPLPVKIQNDDILLDVDSVARAGKRAWC